jgi:hypothetical protein
MNSARQLKPRDSGFSGALIIVGTGVCFSTPLLEKHKVRANDQKPVPVLKFSGPVIVRVPEKIIYDKKLSESQIATSR